MTLIDSIGFDLNSILIFSFTITVIVLSWFSTHVREFPFSANLLIIERRSRRLYTTRNLNGNLRGNNFFLQYNQKSKNKIVLFL